MDNLIKARLQMVRDQIAGRGTSNSALPEAMSKVQRALSMFFLDRTSPHEGLQRE